MPSMWKKQKGGTRISRLVSDLQTSPKRAGSLVVETGFPTSIADLFVKNHDKLKKSTKKRHRSKQPPPSPSTPAPFTPSPYDHPSPGFRSPVSSPSKFETPSCSFDGENDDFAVNSDSYVEDNVAQKNPRLKSSRDHYAYDDDTEEEEEEEENWRVSESKRSIWLLVLKGFVVVAVAIYTRSFVLGVSIGAFLFCMLEYLGNSVLGLLRPCEDVRRELRSFSRSRSRSGASKPPTPVGGLGNEKKPQEGVLNKDIGSKGDKGGENGVVPMKPIIEIVVPSRKIELGGLRNGDVELEDGDGLSKGETDQQNETSTPKTEKFRRLEEEFRKTIRQVEAFYPCCTESTCPSPVPYELQDGEGSEGPEVVGHNEKSKKKKFWGKFVRKQSRRKKNKHRKGKHQVSDSEEAADADCIEENSPESEEGNEVDDEQEMLVREAGTSSLSLHSLDEEEREGLEFANRGSPEMLYAGEGTTKSRRVIKKNNRNLKCLGILGIALAGLTGGRLFALALTVICCLLLRIVSR